MTAKIASIAQRASALAALLAATALPAAAHAANNALDPNFGTQGAVERWDDTANASLWSYPFGVWPASGDRVVVLARRIQRLTAGGADDPSFGTLFAYPEARFPDGRWLADVFPGENSESAPSQPTDADGHPLPGTERFGGSVLRLGAGSVAALADGTVLYTRMNDTTWRATMTKVKLDGSVVRATTFPWHIVDSFGLSTTSGSGAIFSTTSGVVRVRNDGSLDPHFAVGARTALPDRIIMKMVSWDHGGVAVLSADEREQRWDLTLISHTGRVARRIALAHAEFNDYGGPFAPFDYALGVDARGRVLLARSFANHSAITVSRYVDGRVDPTFGLDGRIHLQASHSVDAEGLTVLSDGKIVVLGALQRYGRIYGHNNAMIDGFEEHGAVVWRLNAR